MKKSLYVPLILLSELLTLAVQSFENEGGKVIYVFKNFFLNIVHLPR